MNTGIATDIPRWNLSSIYSGFNGTDYKQAVTGYITGMDKLESLLDNESAQKQDFWAWLAHYLVVSNKNGALEESLNAYAYASYSTDTTNPEYVNQVAYLEDLSVRSRGIGVRFQAVLTHYAQDFSTFFTSYPQFSRYEFVLKEEITDAGHRMSLPEEQLAADLERTGSAAWARLHEQIISNLTDSDTGMVFNEIRNAAYSPDRSVRRRAWETEKKLLKSAEIPLAAALNNIKGATITLNQRRNWTDALDRALVSARMSRRTLDCLISALESALPMWRSYLKLKGRLIAAGEALAAGKPVAAESDSGGCAFYDLFAPLPGILFSAGTAGKSNTNPGQSLVGTAGSPVTGARGAENGFSGSGAVVDSSEKVWSFAEARSYIIDKFSRFAPDMGRFAELAFQNQWIDAQVRKGKVGGAYCIDFPAQKESRVLSNFTGSFSDVITLAHELGHAYHHHCIAGMDYYVTHYPMTLAETASTFAETIVMKDILKQASGAETIRLVETHLQDSCQVLVDILCRFYFERSVFAARDKDSIPASGFCNMMAEAQEKTYGDGLSEERHEYMWAVKSHYYSPSLDFYNFPYAFGLLFALGLYARYEAEGDSFADVYRSILQDTGSYSCEEICRKAGFDIETEEFWKSGIKLFEEEITVLTAFADTVLSGKESIA